MSEEVIDWLLANEAGQLLGLAPIDSCFSCQSRKATGAENRVGRSSVSEEGCLALQAAA